MLRIYLEHKEAFGASALATSTLSYGKKELWRTMKMTSSRPHRLRATSLKSLPVST
jgi:hypothetical protein